MWRAAAVYVVAAITLTYPLAFSLTSSLGALQGPGDPYLNLWILAWGLRAWTSDPASIFSGAVFNANIFFPAEGTLAYSDHFLLQAFALSPVYALTGNAVLCYNLLVLGSIALSGLAMHAYVRAVTGSTLGAYLAGLAWACWPYRTAHLLHIQLQALYFMPLALLWLHRVAAKRRWRDAVGLGCFAALQITASVYYGLMTALALVAVLAQGNLRRCARDSPQRPRAPSVCSDAAGGGLWPHCCGGRSTFGRPAVLYTGPSGESDLRQNRIARTARASARAT